MDIVGTGGDEVGTFNISTTTAFVVAAAGVPVAKHGNRSVSSKSGAADVLEALGAKLTLNAKQCEKVLKDTGICFMFAQMHHSSMKYAAPVRKELGIRTVFNILGPLTNPAGATMQLMGVYSQDMVESMAQVLSNLGVKKGFVVCGRDGLDEVSLTGPTHVSVSYTHLADTAQAYLDTTSAGSGMYVMTSYTPDEEVVLEKNQNYWGEATNVDKFIIKIQPDSNTQMMTLSTGDVDVAMNMTDDTMAELAGVENVEMINGATKTVGFVMMNMNEEYGGPVSDPTVQKAIRKALDYTGIQTIIGEGDVYKRQ